MPRSDESQSNDEQYYFELEPGVCQECMDRNELDKIIFENKKILVRIIDDEENGSTPSTSSNQTSQPSILAQLEEKKFASNDLKKKSDDSDDCEIIQIVRF